MAAPAPRPLKFFIFGHPVTMSPSPDIHEVGFKEAGLPHTYGRFDAPEVEAVLERLRADDCGGGSVTIPHKETLLPSMDVLSESAKVIGAVNTVTKAADGKLHGENTDWLGIKNQLETRLVARRKPDEEQRRPICLLCGAGGTGRAAAFALQRMGAERVLIYNRTPERSAALATEFGFEALTDLTALASLERLDIVVNTLPGNTGFELPDAAVLQRLRPVVFEAAYIPRRTAFVLQALASGCEVVEGAEMLFEQGCEQCELWTQGPAPRAKIAANLLKALFEAGSQHPAHEKMEPLLSPPLALVREAAALAA